MNKAKISGPAIFMYCVIGITLLIAIICFYLYYGNINTSSFILWVGITSFTIMYHFWVRIIMGNVSKFLRKHIKYNQWWFKERKFEKSFYKLLRVKEWKGKALTYNPESFSLKKHSLEDIANSADIKNTQNAPHGIANSIVVKEISSFIQWSTSDFAIVLAISSSE